MEIIRYVSEWQLKHTSNDDIFRRSLYLWNTSKLIPDRPIDEYAQIYPIKIIIPDNK